MSAGGYGLGVAVAAGVAASLRARRSSLGRRARLARALHEIRGPLTVVGLSVELWGRGGAIAPEQRDAIELELARAALALRELEQVCARGRPAPAPEPATETFELGAVLADSVAAWRPAAPGRRIALELAPDFQARVRGDRARLAQATGNLIANALEHGAGPVRVRAQARGGAVRVEVLDAGPGLPAASRRRRAATSRLHGHGLAIARAAAEAHGGRLFGAPSEHGARLVLELPLAAS